MYHNFIYGGIPEWPKGADCKSVVADFGGPNPPSPTKIETYPCGVSLFCLVMVEMRNAAAAVVRNRFRFGELPPFTTAVHFPHLCGKFVVTNPPSPTKTPRACSGCFTDSFFPFPRPLQYRADASPSADRGSVFPLPSSLPFRHTCRKSITQKAEKVKVKIKKTNAEAFVFWSW